MAMGEAARFLPALALGAAVVLCRHAGAQDGFLESDGSMHACECRSALVLRGVVADALDAAIQTLVAAGVMSQAGERFTVIPLAAALAEHRRAAENRTAGWMKRGKEPRALKPPAAAKSPSKRGAKPAVAVGHDATTAAASTTPATPTTRRFGVSDKAPPGDSDVTVVRIRCAGERIAEITRSYVDHLQQTFLHIDVQQQLRLVAVWCESNAAKRKTFSGLRRFIAAWLTRAARDVEISKVISRAAASSNAFGRGGSYERGDVASHPGAAPAGADLDELSDFEAPPPAGPVAKPSPVLAARASLARRAPATPQRRLSELRG